MIRVAYVLSLSSKLDKRAVKICIEWFSLTCETKCNCHGVIAQPTQRRTKEIVY